MNDQDLDLFIELSTLLTGFNRDVFAPQIDPVGLPAQFFDLVQARTGSTFNQLLEQYGQLAGGTPVSKMTPQQQQQIGDQILGLAGSSQDPNVSATACAINKLWYLGSWYQPFDFGGFSAGSQFVVSDQAYIKGLAWLAMQSHAMGNSTWQFGYWAEPPAAPLSSFTGNSNT